MGNSEKLDIIANFVKKSIKDKSASRETISELAGNVAEFLGVKKTFLMELYNKDRNTFIEIIAEINDDPQKARNNPDEIIAHINRVLQR